MVWSVTDRETWSMLRSLTIAVTDLISPRRSSTSLLAGSRPELIRCTVRQRRMFILVSSVTV